MHHHVHYRMQLQEMDKIKETVVKEKHFFIAMELGHHFPVIRLVASLEQTHVSSEQSLV